MVAPHHESYRGSEHHPPANSGIRCIGGVRPVDLMLEHLANHQQRNGYYVRRPRTEPEHQRGRRGASASGRRTSPWSWLEGEKAADALATVYPAVVGAVTGAEGTPGPEVLDEVLRGRRVVLWPDNDGPGRAHMGRIAAALAEAGIAGEVRIFEWSGTSTELLAARLPKTPGTRMRGQERPTPSPTASSAWRRLCEGSAASTRTSGQRVGVGPGQSGLESYQKRPAIQRFGAGQHRDDPGR